jgi:nucleoside-diphosphate-sugar epimerase
MNILVVGGAGYVGGAVTDLLIDTNYNCRVYDLLLYEECYRKPVDFACGDIRNGEALRPHLRWADAVIWLAALVGDGACQLNPEISVGVNQEAVSWLAEHFDGRIVFLSTCSVYGAQNDVILNEQSPTDPLSVYASTKLAAEACLAGKNAIVFRLGTLFGVGDCFSRIRLDLVVNTLTVRAWQQGRISVFGGEQFRPLLHVRDAARACVEQAAGDSRGVYNLHRQNVRILDLAYQVRNHFPDMIIDQTVIKSQDARNYRVSSEKACNELGFRSRCSIDSGIEEIRELLIANRFRDLDNPRYSNKAFLSVFNTHNPRVQQEAAK